MKEITVSTDYERLIKTFLDLQDVSESTRATYRNKLRGFFQWCSENGLNVMELNRADILRYKQQLIEEKKSSYSVSLYITVVRRFFQTVEDNSGGKYHSCARGIKGMKNGSGFKKDALTREQALRLINSQDNQRDRALVSLMLSTGLRTIEIARANVEDIRNIGDDTVLWIQGKGHDSKDEFVKLAPSVLGEIQEYLIDRKAKDGDPLFVNRLKNGHIKRLHPGSISRLIKESLKKININDPRITAHSLRHSTATFARLAGASLEEIQALMRHKSITTTMIYTHTLDKLKANTEEKVLNYMGAVA